MTDIFGFSLFVAANSLILFMLAFNVSRIRLKKRISVGDGGDKDLFNAMRAHGNGLEQVPMFALILLALSMLNTMPLLIAIFAGSFTISRIFHAHGMLTKNFLTRRIGATATYLLQLIAIIALILECFL